MKFIDIPNLLHLSRLLTHTSSPECKVFTRIEAYSCKDVKKDKKLRKEREGIWASEWGEDGDLSISVSPEQKSTFLHSPFGSLDQKEARNMHFLLLSTLNLAYPDYDFSSVSPDEFTREKGAGEVLKALTGTLMLGMSDPSGTSPRSYGSYPGGSVTSPILQAASLPKTSASPPTELNLHTLTHPVLYKILNDVIELEECIVYSYVPTSEADPHADDELDWSEDEDVGTMFDGDSADYEDEEFDGRDENGKRDEDDDDDGMMMMDMDDEDFISNRGSKERRRRSSGNKGGRNAGGGAFGRGRGITPAPLKNSSWDTDISESGPITPGRESYLPVRAKGGLLWSVNYFFYCKRQKRILFISIWARKRTTFKLSPYLMASNLPVSPITLSHRRSIEAMPSLSGMISTMTNAKPLQNPGTEGNPIRIETRVTPPPPNLRQTKSIPKLRRERSETGRTRIDGAAPRANKRVKV